MSIALRAVEVTISLLHLGGILLSTAAHLVLGNLLHAIEVAVASSVCIVIITGTSVLCEISIAWSRRYARKLVEPPRPNKG